MIVSEPCTKYLRYIIGIFTSSRELKIFIKTIMPTVLPQLPTGIAPFIDPLILSRLPLLNSAASNMACVQQSFMQKQFLPIYRNNFLSQVNDQSNVTSCDLK